MPTEIFNSKPKAIQASREEAIKRGCNGVTKYWYSVEDLTSKTTQTKDEYAQENNIPQTIIDEFGNESPNPEYVDLPDTIDVNKSILVIDGNFTPSKEEGVTFLTISKGYAETELMPQEFIDSRGVIPELPSPTIIQYLDAAGIPYSKLYFENINGPISDRVFDLVYDEEGLYNLIAIPIPNLSFLKGEVSSFLTLGSGHELPYGTVWAYDEFMDMIKDHKLPTE